MTNNIWLNRVIFLSQFCIMRMHIERALFHQANKRNRCYLGQKCTQPKPTLFLMGIFQFISLTFFCELHAISHFTICSNKVAYSMFFLNFFLVPFSYFQQPFIFRHDISVNDTFALFRNIVWKTVKCHIPHVVRIVINTILHIDRNALRNVEPMSKSFCFLYVLHQRYRFYSVVCV